MQSPWGAGLVPKRDRVEKKMSEERADLGGHLKTGAVGGGGVGLS